VFLVFDNGIRGDSVVFQHAICGHDIAHVNYLIVLCFIFGRAPVARVLTLPLWRSARKSKAAVRSRAMKAVRF
jgi:hypothetical protein